MSLHILYIYVEDIFGAVGFIQTCLIEEVEVGLMVKIIGTR